MPSNSRFHQILIGVILGLISCSPAQAFRVMTYNLLNYSSGREAEFRTVLEQAEPDILVAEEILSQVAVDYFLANVLDVLDPGEWEAGDFVNGADTDNAIFYRSTKVSYIGHHVIGTTLRDIDEWTVGPVGYGSDASNLRIYALHLKASEGSDNEQRRLDEVTAMRTRMESFPPGQNYIVMGDFNIYDSGEPAYQYMLDTASGIAGVVQDPIDSPGNWHDGSSFAVIHSQSTRTIQFGGGASGGMDDRFDMILVGPAVQDDEGLDILEQTYATFGNDGQHFNKALIDDPPHPELPTEVIEALYNGSDHLPVIADLQVPPILLTDSALEFGSVIVGGTATRVLSVANGAEIPADELDYSITTLIVFTCPSGDFEAEAGDPANLHNIGMSTATPGLNEGDLTLTSDDLDNPVQLIPLNGTVLAHAAPSVSAEEPMISGVLDFETHEPGAFSDLSAAVYNFGYGSLQALLEVYRAELAGDPRFTIVGGFSPATIGEIPASWGVHFDSDGASNGAYAGTLIFRTRDQQDLDGAINLEDLFYDLVATVGTGPSEVPGTSPEPLYTDIISISPNPFRAATQIVFSVAEESAVNLDVFDIGGRRVRSFYGGSVKPGEHRVLWTGIDNGGQQLNAGVYFIQLQVSDLIQTQRVILLR